MRDLSVSSTTDTPKIWSISRRTSTHKPNLCVICEWFVRNRLSYRPLNNIIVCHYLQKYYSQTCPNGHLVLAWPCLMWPLSGPKGEIPFTLNINITWPCPTRSAATLFYPQKQTICTLMVSTECDRLPFSRCVKGSRYTVANQTITNLTGLW